MLDEIGVANALIRHCEGCHLPPYLDLHNLWTVGFGNRWLSDGTPVTSTTSPLSLDQAEQLLRSALLDTQRAIAPGIRIGLRSYEMGAILSLAYNIGPAHFLTSTLLRDLNRGDVDLAWVQFLRWVYVEGKPIRGLVARRTLEAAVGKGQIDPTTFTAIQMPTLPHPLFASSKTTTLDLSSPADALNARELAVLRPIPA